MSALSVAETCLLLIALALVVVYLIAMLTDPRTGRRRRRR